MSTARQRWGVGKWIANYLMEPVRSSSLSPPTPRQALESTLRPGDILLVESRARVAGIIKYLTQSSWAHAALYVGPYLQEAVREGHAKSIPDNHCFIEADLVEGVRSVPLEEFVGLHSRICRPVSLTEAELRQLVAFCIERLGYQYDLRNIMDLARYLFPAPPIPVQWRKHLLYLGSGEPTKAICSTLIAQAFHSIRYPILPMVSYIASHRSGMEKLTKVYRQRHHSLYVPRDFDTSPYFRIVKPTLEKGFDHHNLIWQDEDEHMPNLY